MADQDSTSPIPGLSRETLLKTVQQKGETPSDLERIYLDYNATAPLRSEVIEAQQPYFGECFGNASSLHRSGQQARAAVEKARKECAEVLGCEPDEVVFTSGGTESDNLAIRGLAWAGKDRGHRLVISDIEHPAVRETALALEPQGFEVVFVAPESNGVVRVPDMLAAAAGSATVLALMYANNETGVIQAVAELASARDRERVGYHVDAVQAAGRLPLKVDEIGCDTLAVSGHKLGGPKGVGLLYIRRGAAWISSMTGGQQEQGHRSGTQNVAGIVGLAKALTLAESERVSEFERVRGLRDRIEAKLTNTFSGISVIGWPGERLPNTSFIACSGLEAEDIVNGLDLDGVEVSTGSACSEGTHDQSHVLQAMNIPQEARRGAIRISLGRESTKEKIQEALERMERVFKRLYAP